MNWKISQVWTLDLRLNGYQHTLPRTKCALGFKRFQDTLLESLSSFSSEADFSLFKITKTLSNHPQLYLSPFPTLFSSIVPITIWHNIYFVCLFNCGLSPGVFHVQLVFIKYSIYHFVSDLKKITKS